jgi:hypothetical protein
MEKYKLIFIFLYYYFSGLPIGPPMHRRPLASFSTLYQIYSPQPKPAKPEVVTASVVATLPPLEKQKIKIIIIAKKTSAAPAPPTLVPVPMPLAPVSHQTKKIKITIKKQPQEKQPQEKQPQEKQPQTCSINDIAPPSSMIYTPCSDYIAPPPKCCRFFIDNHHCFLRSSDNACIDPITKKVFGFWNCEIGAKCKLLPIDDDTAYELCQEVCEEVCEEVSEVSQKKENEDFCNNETLPAVEMRKKSDANRSRLSGQPAALLRHKIAMQYGMHSFNSLGN